MCGDHSRTCCSKCFGRGSSPRVRGPRMPSRMTIHSVRIIPACAGTTFPSRCQKNIVEDHPRVCGDHLLSDKQFDTLKGSSPRVRGPLDELHRRIQSVGIIPACAGTTLPHHPMLDFRQDHPRVCGDHVNSISVRLERTGSSPRVRGPLCHIIPCWIFDRIIPACAGTTLTAYQYDWNGQDHPRVCGDH